MCAGNKKCKECAEKNRRKAMYLDFDGDIESMDSEFDDFLGIFSNPEKRESKASDFDSYTDCLTNKPLLEGKYNWESACASAHNASEDERAGNKKEEKLDDRASDFENLGSCLLNKPAGVNKDNWQKACNRVHKPTTGAGRLLDKLSKIGKDLKEASRKDLEQPTKKEEKTLVQENMESNDEGFLAKNKTLLIVSGSALLIGAIGFVVYKKIKK